MELKKGPEVNVREGAMGSCRYATVVSLHTAPQFQQYRLVAYPTRQHNALAMHLASKWGERQAIVYGIALEAVCCAPQGQTPTQPATQRTPPSQHTQPHQNPHPPAGWARSTLTAP